MEGNPDSGTQEIFAWGIWNSGFFSCGIWNPGLWNPEYSLRNPESHLRLESTIHVPLTKNPESKTWNPESKSVLDSPLHEEKFKLYETILIWPSQKETLFPGDSRNLTLRTCRRTDGIKSM